MRFFCLVWALTSLASLTSVASAQEDEPPNPFGQGADEGPDGPAVVDHQSLEPECTSPCPAGTTCAQGQCVALCNPACGDGFVCAAGRCVPASGGYGPQQPQAYPQPGGPQGYAQQPGPGYGPGAYQPQPQTQAISGRPAVVRGAVGLGLGALALGLGLGAYASEPTGGGIFTDDFGGVDAETITPLILTGLSAAVTIAGVFVARSGSTKVRRHGAQGIGFFRVTTFIFMIGALLVDLTALALSGVSDDSGYPNAHLVGGLLGGLALFSAGTDALVAGLQSNRLYRAQQGGETAWRWVPRLGRIRDVRGNGAPAVTWGGLF